MPAAHGASERRSVYWARGARGVKVKSSLVPKFLLGHANVLEALLPHAWLTWAVRLSKPRGEAELRGQVRSQAGAWERGRDGVGGSPIAVWSSRKAVGGLVEDVSGSPERAGGSGETVSCPQQATGRSPGAVSGSRKTAGGSPEIISCVLKMAFFAHPAADLLC